MSSRIDIESSNFLNILLIPKEEGIAGKPREASSPLYFSTLTLSWDPLFTPLNLAGKESIEDISNVKMSFELDLMLAGVKLILSRTLLEAKLANGVLRWFKKNNDTW